MTTKVVPYYVTNNGLAASLASEDILFTMRGILAGRSHPMTLRAFLKRGYIALDQRGANRTDHNSLILTGAVERVREVLITAPPIPPAVATASDSSRKKGTKPGGRGITYALQPAPEPTFSPTVEKVRAALKDFLDKDVTFAQLHAHPTLKTLNPGTLRWAIQMLRRAGLMVSKERVAA